MTSIIAPAAHAQAAVITHSTKSADFSPVRNVFSHTDTRKGFAESERCEESSSVLSRRSEVATFHKMKYASIVERWEQEATIPLKERERGIKTLVVLAAVRGVTICKEMGYEDTIMEFIRETWTTLMLQTFEFFNCNHDSDFTYAQRITEAIENVSSLGIWYSTMNTSIPLRRFLVHVPDENGDIKPHIVVGLVSFSYSSYIMEIRRESQWHMLHRLHEIRQEFGAECLFLPKLLVSPPTPTTTS